MYFQCGHTPDLRKDWTMEDKSKYFVVKQKAVPEVLLKVVEAKKLLETERAIKSSGSSGAASSRDSGKAYRVSSDRISSRNTTEKGTTRYSNRSFSITKRGCCKPHPPAVHRQSPLFSKSVINRSTHSEPCSKVMSGCNNQSI